MADVGAVVGLWAGIAGNSACVISVVIMIRGRKDVDRIEHELRDIERDKE